MCIREQRCSVGIAELDISKQQKPNVNIECAKSKQQNNYKCMMIPGRGRGV